jgi:hypothetical protein
MRSGCEDRNDSTSGKSVFIRSFRLFVRAAICVHRGGWLSSDLIEQIAMPDNSSLPEI